MYGSCDCHWFLLSWRDVMYMTLFTGYIMFQCWCRIAFWHALWVLSLQCFIAVNAFYFVCIRSYLVECCNSWNASFGNLEILKIAPLVKNWIMMSILVVGKKKKKNNFWCRIQKERRDSVLCTTRNLNMFVGFKWPKLVTIQPKGKFWCQLYTMCVFQELNL